MLSRLIRRSDHDAFKGNECPYNCVVYHPEKDYIITGDWKGLLKIWDLTSLERKAILRGNKASIQDLKLAPDASIVISGDILGTVCVFNGKYLYVYLGDIHKPRGQNFGYF